MIVQGQFTADAHALMFFIILSWQTFEGIQIIVHSIVEVTKYLLGQGMEYVLTEHFCQDPVEEYLGNQRMLGRRCDNPDIQTFGYNDNTIRIQRHIALNTGNMCSEHRNEKWVKVTNDSLQCRTNKH